MPVNWPNGITVFTLEDEQIVWTNKSSHLMWKWDEQPFGRLSRRSLSVYEDDFSKTICSSRQTSRPKSDLNSHLRRPSRENGTIKRSDEFEFWEIFWESQHGGKEEGCEERNEKKNPKEQSWVECTSVDQTVEWFVCLLMWKLGRFVFYIGAIIFFFSPQAHATIMPAHASLGTTIQSLRLYSIAKAPTWFPITTSTTRGKSLNGSLRESKLEMWNYRYADQGTFFKGQVILLLGGGGRFDTFPTRPINRADVFFPQSKSDAWYTTYRA